jgi:hypothetical protein
MANENNSGDAHLLLVLLLVRHGALLLGTLAEELSLLGSGTRGLGAGEVGVVDRLWDLF